VSEVVVRTRGASFLFAAGLAVALALPSPASAADPTEEKATEVFRAGNRHYRAGELRDAEAAYQAAWELRPGFDIGASLGVTEAELGAHRDAAEHLAYSLRAFPMSGDPQKRRTIEETLARSRGEVGVLRVTVDAEGAAITVGGRALAREATPGELFVDAGDVVIEATREGRAPARARVTVAKGQVVDVALSLPPLASAPASARRDAPGHLVPMAFGVGATALFLGAGLFFTVVSNGQSGEASDLQSRVDRTGRGCGGGANQADCAALRDALDASDAARDGAVVAFAGAGAAAIATGVIVLWPHAEPASAAAVRARPLVGPGFAGAGLSGRF
jgi:tetratricopeptide (TPR) repeat protein